MKESEQSYFLQLKENGNAAFKSNHWNEALDCYSKALNYCTSNSEKIICYKNRAAVHLKLEQYEKAMNDATKVLEMSPNDPKALYRRCQALDHLNRFEEAYRDARHLLLTDPGNKDIQPILTRLHQKVQDYARQNSDIGIKISQMFRYAFSTNEDEQKKITSWNNILTIARETNGAKALFEANIVQKIFHLMKIEKNFEIRITVFYILCELMKNNVDRAKKIISNMGIPWLCDMLNSEQKSEVIASQNCLQTLIDTLSGQKRNPDTGLDEEMCKENKEEIDTILTCLVYSCNSRTISGLTRDATLQLIMRNVHYKALNWSIHLIEIKGVQRLLEIASELSEFHYECSMNVTESTRSIVAACLARVYENMYYDKARNDFLENVNEFIKNKLLAPDTESKIRLVVTITVLLTGPLDVGNFIIGKDGVIEMILSMAASENLIEQKISCECIVAAISKQDKAQFVVSKGVNILKKLYDSNDESIRVRALVGLCKAASSGGTDASLRLFAEGSTIKMAESCKKFLINGKLKDTKRWAAEGFAFLSFNAEVKELLVADEVAIKNLIEVAKSNLDSSSAYGIVNIFVNLCNAYEKKEILPEMVELAKFAKRHVPEEHEFDKDDFVVKRLNILGNLGLTSALVALSKVESDNCKELICRVFNALCSQQQLRGLVVQQGGVKVLIRLALEGTDIGKKQSAQALARIGITMNPEVAFPGQRCIEIIRPLITLLHPDCSGLENFEALMALCNLASISEKIREHIFIEKGVSKIETYMYEDHLHLRRAATQCITNLAMSPLLAKIYEGENDKFKFLFLLCGEEDEETSKAACGAVAILTTHNKIFCDKIFNIKAWLEIFKQILVHPNVDIQLRAVAITENIIESSKENAEELLSSQVMEILMALSIISDEGRENIKKNAEKCLEKAEELNIIKKPNHNQE